MRRLLILLHLRRRVWWWEWVPVLDDVDELRRRARLRGTRAGRDAAAGRHHARTIAELPGRRQLEADCGQRQSQLERLVSQHETRLNGAIGSAKEREKDARARATEATAQVKELERELDETREDR